MAAQKPPARRIVPMRIGDGSASRDAMPLGDASNDALQSPSRPPRQLDLREQAAIARQKLGSGRRIFVDIQKDGSIVDWHKLMKAAGMGRAPASPAAGPADEPAAPDNLFKESSRPKNAFSSVIQRLEQAYAMNDGEGSSNSEQESGGRADSGQSAEEEGDDKRGGESGHESARDGAAGAAKPKKPSAAGGVPRDDQYDYEDNFIDDSEIIEYYAGDRRKAKHSGFFVNSGEIEKTGELIDKQEASPRKRRKKALGAGAAEEGGQPAKRLKHDDAPAAAMQAPAAAEVVPETRDGFEHTAASASLAHLAGAEPSTGGISHQHPAPGGQGSARKKRKPAAADVPGASGDRPFVISREAYAVIAALRQLAAAEAASAPPEGANKKIPESLRLALSEEFIGPYMRDLPKHKDAQAVLVTTLMEFMEPFTTRGNLLRLLNQWKSKVTSEYDLAKGAVRDQIKLGCTAAEAKAGAQGAAARSSFDWTPELLSTLLAFVHLRGLVKGKAMIENGRIWSQIADLFDHHLMDAASIEQAFKGALAAGLSRTVAVLPSPLPLPAAAPAQAASAPLQAAAAPATQLPAAMPASAPAQVAAIMQQALAAVSTPQMPAISPAAAAPGATTASLPAPPLPPAMLAAQHAAAQAVLPPLRTGSVGGAAQLQPALQSPLGQAGAQYSNPPAAGADASNSAITAAEVDPAPHIAAGLLLGGDLEQLTASQRAFAKGSMKALVNLTLMHAGSKGFKTADIVEYAATSGIADWRADRSKRSYLSSVVSKEPSFVNVGAYHYALRAFPGVTEAGANVERAKAAAMEAQAAAAAAAVAAAGQILPPAAFAHTSAPAQPAAQHMPAGLSIQTVTSQPLPPTGTTLSMAPQPPQADTNLG